MPIIQSLQVPASHVLRHVSDASLLRTVWNVNHHTISQVDPINALLVWSIAHRVRMPINAILVGMDCTSMVNMRINEGISCTSCGTYCRECDQNSGVCTKCLEGYMISDGTCVLCTGSVCSCETLSQYKIIYN